MKNQATIVAILLLAMMTIMADNGFAMADNGFTFISSKFLAQGKFRALTESIYELPDGHLASFEIVTSPRPLAPTDPAVTCLAYNLTSSKFLLIKEFYPSLGRISYGTIAGLLDSRDTSSSNITERVLNAAKREAWEEGRVPLNSDAYINPTPCMMDKYVCTQLYSAFCAFNSSSPHSSEWNQDLRDEEEQGMEIVEVTEDELLELLHEGKFSVVGEWAVRRGLEMHKKYMNTNINK
ncbi:hypothetical protein TL16_g12244 [Triparma laevis f. inornata]|uniref:Nudix hydrolase domain-containing protein n=2 Tax=Triparma laevis TaxID=1534972 RepID=A0A9W6ZJY8_9STRA|nr:hypothetical protein TrLO_g15956 [Triparma laevis f. longispina]GMH92087.1 hypothetical protein TL16_g12244 [Triparma laevis f. inornata]